MLHILNVKKQDKNHMEKTTNVMVLVTCMEHENYGIHAGTNKTLWVPRSNKTYKVYADFDKVLYGFGEEKLVASIKEHLVEKSTNLYKYVYVSHEVILNELEDISAMVIPKFESKFESAMA